MRINGDFPGNKSGWPFVYTGSFNPGNLVISGSILNGDAAVFSANNLNVLGGLVNSGNIAMTVAGSITVKNSMVNNGMFVMSTPSVTVGS